MKLLLIGTATAIIRDQCKPGSDADCINFGNSMCCANIEYRFNGDSQQFHACANQKGIEYTKGVIYDNVGISGTWYCNSAVMLPVAFAFGLAAAAI
jgi:hypothetical protein